MAIHLDHNRKRKGLTQEDLPNIPSASHSRAAEGCAEFQCVLPRPMLISMPVPLLGWISPREGPLLPQSPQGLKLCWALYVQEDLFFLAFEKPKHRAQPLQLGAGNCRALTFMYIFPFIALLAVFLGQQSYSPGLACSQSQREACAWAFPRSGPEMASHSVAVDSQRRCTHWHYEGTSAVSPRASRRSLKW